MFPTVQTFKNSLREACYHIFLPGSFILSKNMSNKHIFIKFRSDTHILNNYHNI